MVRFQIVLTPDEFEALTKMAEKEMREIRDQVRFLIRQDLLKCGQLQKTQADVESTIMPTETENA